MTSIGRGTGEGGAEKTGRHVVAPGLRLLPRSAAFCNVPTVNIPILLHLYLIVRIDRPRGSAWNRASSSSQFQKGSGR